MVPLVDDVVESCGDPDRLEGVDGRVWSREEVEGLVLWNNAHELREGDHGQEGVGVVVVQAWQGVQCGGQEVLRDQDVGVGVGGVLKLVDLFLFLICNVCLKVHKLHLI